VRTPGGTRRYRPGDIDRLRKVKAAVDAGHRISHVAKMDAAELERFSGLGAKPHAGFDAALSALERFDSQELHRLTSLQLAALGPLRFAREFALPLSREIGDRWAKGSLSIGSEHLATGILHAMLGAALTPTAASRLGPKIIFATPPGERHELGLQSAALAAMGAGANPVYLGADVPIEDLLHAVEESKADVLALGLVALAGAAATRVLRALRGGLPDETRLWVGGAGAVDIKLPDAVELIGTLDDLEQRVALLGFES
jgi:methanogenic corrinoid protein MtbC1